MLNAKELVQWENGLSFNDIAARQGIRIRRHFRPTASLKQIEEELGAPRNILEKIVWDKEIEVAQVCSCNSVHVLDFCGSVVAISYCLLCLPGYLPAVGLS
jgi:hypothetical protein